MAERPKNILLLWTDQQRADTVGTSKEPLLQMPNLERLAASGALFEQAYCAQPVCSPARASVLTGVYPHANGVIDNKIDLSPNVPTIAELLQPAGYSCGYIGKWHLGGETRAQRGFDYWVNTEDSYVGNHATEGYSAYYHYLVSRGHTPSDPHHDSVIFDRRTAARLPEEEGKPAFQATEAIRFLETHRDQPFLLSVNFSEPHSPYAGPFDDLYEAEEMTLPESWYLSMEETVPLPVRRLREAYARGYMAKGQLGVKSNDEPGWKELKTRYWGLCTLVDKYVGRILTGLEELGLADDTIVVYTSDHGHIMGEHRLLNKSVQYEPSTQIPLIIRAPGTSPRRVATPVSHVDLVSTLLDLLDRPLPEHLHGTSLVSLLGDGDTALDDGEVVIEWSGLSATELVNAASFLGLPTDDSHVAVRTIRRGRWKLNVSTSGEHELYDLQADPAELHNAFGDPGNRVVTHDLYGRLLRWQRATDDTLSLPEIEAT